MKTPLLLAAAVLWLGAILPLSAQEPGELDLSFDTGSVVNSTVRAVVPLAGGKMMIGGGFTIVRGALRNGIARINADGTVDETFDPGSGADGTVYSVAVQADGKVLIGGFFTSYNGTARNRIARLNSDGSLDASFDPGSGANSSVRSVAVQADGKVLIGGNFAYYNGTWRSYIARLNSDGSLDTSFDPGTGANREVYSVAVQADGKVLIGGDFTDYNGTWRNGIARLNSDGSLDTSFNPGSGAYGADRSVVVEAVAVQADGKVLIGGGFTSFDGMSRSRIARLNSNGSLDTSFDSGFGVNGSVISVAVQADGKVFIGGSFSGYNVTPRSRIARLNSNGSLDTSFNPGTGTSLPSTVHSVTVQADGKVLIGGQFTSYNGTGRHAIARLNSGGSLDTSFNPGSGANSLIYAVGAQADGKVLIGGNFTSYNDFPRNRIARLGGDGSLDTSFNPGTGANGLVYSVAEQVDGKVLIGGEFINYNGTARNRIAQLNSDGSLDTSFNPGTGADSSVTSMAVQADGRVLIGGYFTSYNGTGRNRIARLNSDGSQDTSFDPGTGADGDVRSVAVQADGKVLIGGGFTSYDGTPRNRIARLNSDGSLDASFNPGTGADSTVTSVVVQADGKVLIGGGFTSHDGTPRNRIARLNSDGGPDTSFDPGTGASATIYSMAVQADGKVLIGGAFSSYNGTPQNRITRLNSDGSLDASFNPGTGPSNNPGGGTSNWVHSVVLQADGKVLIGGAFITYNGTGRSYLARLGNDAAVQALSAPLPTRVLWTRSGAAPEVEQVTFELCTNGGTTWTPLGSATRISGGWERTGLSLPASGHLRARGRTIGGYYSGSSGMVEQVVAFIATPEIALSGNGVDIANNGATPSTADHTDFGSVDVASGSVVRTFTVTNGGTGVLNLTGTPRVARSGSSAFMVTTQPASATVAASGGTVTFQVIFDPATLGPHSATLSIANDDSDENPFTFVIAGTGTNPITTQQDWRQFYFGTTANSGDAADTFDFDFDGLVNLLEWACGLNPTTASTLDTAVVRNGGNLEFTYTRSEAAVDAGAVFIVEWSDSLAPGSWDTAGVVQTSVSNNGTLQQMKATLPEGSSGRRFVRLNVTAPP